MLKDLGFLQALNDHLENFNLEDLLGYRCQPPYNCISSPIIKRNIVPLWECGVELTYFNKDTNHFEQCSLEAIDAPYFCAKSPQAVLANIFIYLYEDELSEVQLRAVASKVGFLHLERLLTSISNNQGNEYEAWRSNFIISCEG